MARDSAGSRSSPGWRQPIAPTQRIGGLTKPLLLLRNKPGIPDAGLLPRGPTNVYSMRSAFGEHVLVLTIANDQRPLAGPVGDHKLESHVRRVGGYERDRAVIVLARGHFAFPFSEIECRRASVVDHREIAEGWTRIAPGQRGHQIGSCGHNQSLTLFGEFGFEVRSGGIDISHCLRLSIEHYFEQVAHHRAEIG